MSDSALITQYRNNCTYIDSELQIIAKLIKRNKSQHRSTHVFKLLTQIQRIYSLIPLSDIAMMIESMQSATISMYAQKPTADVIEKIFSLCKDDAKVMQWHCELADVCAKAGRLLIVSISQKLFLPLYCTFLASCSRVLRNVAKLCIYFSNQLECLLSYLKSTSSRSDKFEQLIHKEMISWTCMKCYCFSSTESVCNDLICSKHVRLIDILKRAESPSASDPTYNSLKPSLSLNFGTNKRLKVDNTIKSASVGVNAAAIGTASGSKNTNTSSSSNNNSDNSIANQSNSSSNSSIAFLKNIAAQPSPLIDEGDDVGYVMAVLGAQDNTNLNLTFQIDGYKKKTHSNDDYDDYEVVEEEEEEGNHAENIFFNNSSESKDDKSNNNSSRCSNSTITTAVNDEGSKLLISDMFDTDGPAFNLSSSSTLRNSNLNSEPKSNPFPVPVPVVVGKSSSKKRKHSSKNLAHLEDIDANSNSTDIDDIFLGF